MKFAQIPIVKGDDGIFHWDGFHLERPILNWRMVSFENKLKMTRIIFNGGTFSDFIRQTPGVCESGIKIRLLRNEFIALRRNFLKIKLPINLKEIIGQKRTQRIFQWELKSLGLVQIHFYYSFKCKVCGKVFFNRKKNRKVCGEGCAEIIGKNWHLLIKN